ncbi:peptide-methionine (S)-S-oxide reductase MsrA [Gammaproteobacteria bacterium]|jgi:peptide-methionine (S)-S-oxide reductase|nr:peptide-methionine (S)-S-oxide reductase MsrA [Gammaproteobacteria bacterium]MEC8314736.1 peptide-methionine (S)-S-oxide reductase MsrA [Pseudomonadota bacterium]MEC8448714.1 peptide-methionine (S)-S-oxide reductase MsrA [Pseudomonadota bacterium]MEC8797944.1 peptide-methionine (S)-S-oxide reductase MsrA [Pseudomonadota bacterium]MED5348813.1 peptide-methionine (S)-S-oxide reductase MsrA [Pseudomonadota bacterium]|tara:strand:- start:1179 stop:1820 length:642 start_codon:yes stop_codon:yes gene_type:complete
MSLMDLLNKKSILPLESEALLGRDEEIEVPTEHFVKGTPLKGPFPDNLKEAIFGMGCFWGVERRFWELDGVYSTAAGYAGGFTKNPSYKEVCTGFTGHNEVVLVVYDPAIISYESLLTTFWEDHDPTQGMRQGNDIGTQYRSGIYFSNEEEKAIIKKTMEQYQAQLKANGLGQITTEVKEADQFYYAEHYHQQYLAKNPDGYCALAGTGVKIN